MENISSVACRLESEIRLPYWVNRLFTNISFLFSVEYAQSFAGGLQMGDKLFALNVKRLFGFAQALVYLYDMLRNLSKLIVRKGGLYVHVY